METGLNPQAAYYDEGMGQEVRTGAVTTDRQQAVRNDAMNTRAYTQQQPLYGTGEIERMPVMGQRADPYDAVDPWRVAPTNEPVATRGYREDRMCMMLSAFALLLKNKGILDDGQYQLIADIEGRDYEEVIARIIDVATTI